MSAAPTPVSRRAFLRTASSLLALPALESFGHRAFAAEKAVSAPTRMAFLYIPNGVNMNTWTVKGEGAGYQLSPTLQPLAGLKNDFTIFSNLAHDKAESNGDGAGDHARATATFLTGCQAKKTAGADIRLGESVDQIAASQLGHHTRLASLELSTDGERSSGRCDSGYSCAYQFNLSWKTDSMPMAPEMDPRLVFERLFGVTAGVSAADREKRSRYQKSILDFALSDAKSLQRRLSANDNRKIDEYFASVRDIETRIEKAERMKMEIPPGVTPPAAMPGTTQEHIRMMFDLLLLSFQTDSTRIATFMLAHDGSNRNFPELGVPDAHHNLSHHQNNAEKLEKIAKIDLFYVQQLAYFLQRLKDTKEGSAGNLLDSSMIVYGGGISDGNTHDHDRLPVILAGRANGTLNPGRHINLSDKVPMTNLYLAMLDRMGAKAERIGDSTGVLEGI
ncbi:hypothetical protein AYO49_06380 [Verrucomicrobiaceae bacterium SCGC AG-212-N21]|nr:hypothetical protein AYO49_06380 [Verrucomicrobiaceae bacterium SCGC AG-212-N21]